MGKRKGSTKVSFFKQRRLSVWGFFLWQIALVLLLALGMFLLSWNLFFGGPQSTVPSIVGIILLVLSLAVQLLTIDPSSVRAWQTETMLRLANDSLTFLQDGLNNESAQKVCELLLPSTAAIAVAITDKQEIMGYAGYRQEFNRPGYPISTQATHEVIKDGSLRIMYSSEEIGFPDDIPGIQAGIIVPFSIGDEIIGTVKFYFSRAWHISDTQLSIAKNFGSLLSTQISAAALESERKESARMRLKMLQSQINPHFLFNTINTIASLVRTDPEKARSLLREVASFYRGMLDDSSDLIRLSLEIEQTERYFRIEEARFGEDRVSLETDIDPLMEEFRIPPFIIQPLVENAVRHAMPYEGKLTICIKAEALPDGAVIRVVDDGRGMTPQTVENIMNPRWSEGLGIAVKNVNERICGVFGEGTRMEIESEPGVGTKVSLILMDSRGPGHPLSALIS